jgi:hypothetical protein
LVLAVLELAFQLAELVFQAMMVLIQYFQLSHLLVAEVVVRITTIKQAEMVGVVEALVKTAQQGEQVLLRKVVTVAVVLAGIFLVLVVAVQVQLVQPQGQILALAERVQHQVSRAVR